MKTIKAKAIIQAASDLADLRKEQGEIKRREAELRAILMEALGDETAAQVGAWLVLVEERKRRAIDRDAVVSILGDRLSEVETEEFYNVLSVRKA